MKQVSLATADQEYCQNNFVDRAGGKIQICRTENGSGSLNGREFVVVKATRIAFSLHSAGVNNYFCGTHGCHAIAAQWVFVAIQPIRRIQAFPLRKYKQAIDVGIPMSGLDRLGV